jgi:glycosyltransferase involved in cell wall biosynthesis
MTCLPKISIVTPSLNMGRFIEDAILSVVKQGYPNFEHIVVDACSGDNTLAVLRSYPHLRWISEPDAGMSDALNKGFRMATGDLVGWLNADEYYLPGAFHAVGRIAMENPGADILYGDSIFVDEEGRLQRAKTAHEFSFTILLYYGCFIPTDATFLRRHFIEKGFFIDTNYRVVMDFEYFVRCAASGKHFKYINRLLGTFRWQGSNLSLQDEKRRKERLLVQRTWSKLKLPSRGYDALAEVGRLYRGVLKLLNGNYRAELKALQSVGSETRWFRNDEGGRTCAALLE